MFDTTKLPAFHFVDDGGKQTTLRLSESAGRIRALSKHLHGLAQPGSPVGLMYRSGPDLVVNWLAVIAAGYRPLIMQYPTKKQSAAYWADSVRNTIEVAGLAMIVADDHCAALGLGKLAKTLAQSELQRLPDASGERLVLDSFAILQLSSGTTGYRKAIEFTSANLERHVTDFNHSLELTKTDRIVSWLPLYHDMGYIACFVMPLALGIEVTMMDPMTWVKTPELLFDAIEGAAGTVCYMPNFGFEVMSRCKPRSLPSMRWWVSCSEPVSADTSRKFLGCVGSAESTFAPCYAMAENIFAVSIRRGIGVERIDESNVVSCGAPIRGVELKIVDGEVWARSPTSLKCYIGLADARDAEGFYPTGDLGRIIEGELFITGRKQDLLIQAGRKYMLSDIDLVLNRQYPDIRGRAVTVQVYDERLGTQKPVILVESQDFFTRNDQAQIAASVKAEIGLDQIEVDFVPPRFLTKTSSGKFNRKKSAHDWQLRQSAGASSGTDPLAELERSFGRAPWDLPVEEALDSLSLTVLQIILSDTAVKYDGGFTLAQFAERLKRPPAQDKARERECIRIVSLADRRIFSKLNDNHLKRLARLLGAPVSFEHICLPPAAIVLSDLIFCDWFLPRVADREPYAAVERAMNKLRSASIVLVDDVAEMFFPPNQVYGALSHNLERDPRADLLAVRWQRYPQCHDRLPLTVIAGTDLPLDQRTRSIEMLSQYLQRPVFRIATIRGFQEFTQGWEFRSLRGRTGAPGGLETIEPHRFVDVLAGWVDQLPAPLVRTMAPDAGNKLEMTDLAHYCSRIVNRSSVDKLLAHYQSFCVVGQDGSVPYVRRKLDEMGKKYVQVPSYAPEILRNVKEPFECMVICGSQGRYPIDAPAAALMVAQSSWKRTKNIDDPSIANLAFIVSRERAPESGSDWFYPPGMDRGRNEAQIIAVRDLAARLTRSLRKRQADRKAGRDELAEDEVELD
jgi:acyl-CoA synthetase (AMP-forming)/AMP-acid ligase II